MSAQGFNLSPLACPVWREYHGMWMVYGYSDGPYLRSIHQDPVEAIEALTTGEEIGFLPVNTELRDAIELWNKRDEGVV